jgi:hypothetical protein
MGIIIRDLNDASVETHIILEIIWGHLSTAISDVIWLIFVPNANPSTIANLMSASKKAPTDQKGEPYEQ